MITLTTKTEIKTYFENGILLDTATKREMVATIKNHNFGLSFLLGLFADHDEFRNISIRLIQIADYMIDELKDGIA